MAKKKKSTVKKKASKPTKKVTPKKSAKKKPTKKVTAKKPAKKVVTKPTKKAAAKKPVAKKVVTKPTKKTKKKSSATINTAAMTQTSMIDDIASEFDDESELDAMVGLEDDALTNAVPLEDEDPEEDAGMAFENLEDEEASDDMEDDMEDDLSTDATKTEEDDDEGYF